jgi:hypothetical protein
MHWIFTHIWLTTSAAIIGIGGFLLAITLLKKPKRKIHPTPKRRLSKNEQLNNARQPLLIRLPKLG